jgi:hypothetical protein
MWNSSRTGAGARGLILAVVLIGAACDNKSPSGPSSVPQSSSSAVKALKITGPTRLSPDDSAESLGQYSAIATLADGSTVDETTRANWSSSDTAVVRLTSTPGRMQAGGRGEAFVRATVAGATAQFPMFVSEPGTFRVAGIITESETDVRLSGVDIEVVSGAGAGMAAHTDGSGYYKMFGVGGEVTMRATKDGFGSKVQSVTVTDYTTINFVLTTTSSPVDVSGDWKVGVSASTACRGTLPALARDREYDATIVQQGERVTITLVNPAIGSLGSESGRFVASNGLMFGNRLTFDIPGDTEMGDWSTPDFYERLNSSLSLALSLRAQVVITGPENAGTASGDIEVWNLPMPGTDRPAAVCRAQDHAIVLRRR